MRIITQNLALMAALRFESRSSGIGNPQLDWTKTRPPQSVPVLLDPFSRACHAILHIRYM
jgi:hypothetical protein